MSQDGAAVGSGAWRAAAPPSPGTAGEVRRAGGTYGLEEMLQPWSVDLGGFQLSGGTTEGLCGF